MSDIVVAPWRTGWTVRHERILFERFDHRRDALRRAEELRRLMVARGETVQARCQDARPPRLTS